jgi:ankyrin repeat protein
MPFSPSAVRPVSLWLLLLAVWAALAGCEAPEQRAVRELRKHGEVASGQALVEAVLARDEAGIGRLLAASANTEQVDAWGRTPLRIAVEGADPGTVRQLLEAGADANAVVPGKGCVLAAALDRGESAMAEWLIASGAAADGPTEAGEVVLVRAIRSGRLVAATAMIRAGADPDLADAAGTPALHLAMAAGRRLLAEELLARGADAGGMDSRGSGTLHLAFHQGWLDLIPRLLAAGADPNLAGEDAEHPLQLAVNQQNADLASLLLAVGAEPRLSTPRHPVSPLESVVARGSPEMLGVFLHHRAGLDGHHAAEAFRAAIVRNDLAAARVLLSRGAPASFRDIDRLLPVEAAVARGRGSFVKLLLDYGQPAGAALQMASARGDERMVALLLACGVHPDWTPPPVLETPLAAALRAGHDRLACLLLRHGASPTLRLPEGQTPLHLALVKGCNEALGQLLAAGADPNAPFLHPVSPVFLKAARNGVVRWALRNDRNVTPLMVAVDAGDLHVARLLLDAGAKKSVWTRNAKLWPINFASRRNDIAMMRLLLGRDPDREERHIVVNLSQQMAWLYDHEGNEIFSTRVSTGKKAKPTPTGEYVITNKYRRWTSSIYDVEMPYFQRLSCSDFGLHAGHVPGYPASSGCIRVPPAVAAKLFAMTQPGDRVRIDP